MSSIMDTRQTQCVSGMPSSNNVYDGYQNKILCIMDTGYKYCVSWIQDIYFVTWVQDINSVYHGFHT